MAELVSSGGAGAKVAPAHIIISKGDGAKTTLDKIFKVWAKRYPAELREYISEVKFKRETLRNGTGMATTGDYAAHGIVPVRMQIALDKLIPGFWANGGMDLWHDLFPDFKIRTEKLGYR